MEVQNLMLRSIPGFALGCSAGLLIANCLLANGYTQRRPDPNREHTEWIASTLKKIQTIKAGSTRRDLLTVFTHEGGLSSRTSSVFVLRECPYIKVAVTLRAVGTGGPRSTTSGHGPDLYAGESDSDVVQTITTPYLQWSIMD